MYTIILDEKQIIELDLARGYLTSVTEAATQPGNLKDETRIERIQSALGSTTEALNAVLAIQHGKAQGEQ